MIRHDWFDLSRYWEVALTRMARRLGIDTAANKERFNRGFGAPCEHRHEMMKYPSGFA